MDTHSFTQSQPSCAKHDKEMRMKQPSVYQRISQVFKSGVFIIVMLCLLVDLAQPLPASAAPLPRPSFQGAGCTTTVETNITADTTWDISMSPICLADNIYVNQGATLTIDPGVTVEGLLWTALIVYGTLDAQGTSGQPIVMTSSLDTAEGEWIGLVIDGYYGGGTATLDYVTIRYGGAPYYGSNANLLLDSGAQATVSNSHFSNSSGDGVVMADFASSLVFSGNTLQNNAAYPLVLYHDDINQASANTFSGNHPDRVLVQASGNPLAANATWRKNNGAGVYELADNVTVAAGATLTLEPGLTLMARDGVYLSILGALSAVGTSTAPITFTSTADTASQQWAGIEISGSNGQGTATLDYAIIRYGGLAYYGSMRGLGIEEGGSAVITNSQLIDNYGYGLQLTGDTSQLTFHHNTVSGSTYAPLWVLPHNLAGIHDNTFTGNGSDQVRTGDQPLPMEFTAVLSNTNLVDAYEIRGYNTIGAYTKLSVEPGVTLLAAVGTSLLVQGSFEALGTADEPVLISSAADVPGPGDWTGLHFEGWDNFHARGTLNYTTVEYGGATWYSTNANINTYYADVTIDHSVVRNSAADGLSIGEGSEASRIENSSIVDNPSFGVFNTDGNGAFVAVNNWWGSNSGPRTTDDCNPSGIGALISNSVIFKPFITAAGAEADPLEPRDMAYASIRPARWYAPADGSSQISLEVTVLDGAGNPLPLQSVRLVTNLGALSLVDLTTNAAGKAYTSITSDTEGTADVSAVPGVSTLTCTTNFQPAVTQVNFTADSSSELGADEPAPYMNEDFETLPEPLTQGVPTIIRLHLTNPYSYPLTINGTVGYAQFGIGQTFGPISEVVNWVLPPNQESTLDINWIPPLSDHFCVVFDYWYDVVEPAQLANGQTVQMMKPKTGKKQKNFGAKPGPLVRKKPKDLAGKAQKAIDMMGDAQWTLSALKDRANIPGGFIQDQMVGNILDFNFDVWGAASCALQGGENCGGWKGPRLKLPGGGYGSIGKDPPSQNYMQIAPADPITFTPVQAGPTMPAARAAAINELTTASLKLTVNLMAAVASNDRYAGASAAGDGDWSNQQASAFIYYLDESAKASIEVADKIDALLAELQAEEVTDFQVSEVDYQAYQARLIASGFNATELAAAHLVGLDDETIEKIRLRRIANITGIVSGEMIWRLSGLSYNLRAFGEEVLHPVFSVDPVTSGAADPFSAADDNLVLVQPLVSTFAVGNPTDHTAIMTLKILPIDIPADWSVYCDRETVTLEPGQSATVTLTVVPGSVSVQGTQPRVAVEGYIDGVMVGGVVQDVVVPTQVSFVIPPPEYKVYLPVMKR